MEGNYYFAPELDHLLLNNNMSPSTHFLTNLPYNYYQLQHQQQQIPMLDCYPQSSYNNNSSSTSDEADENQMSIINERKQRRMISNRESARRSRMRKQKQLDELCTQVMRLRNENRGLMDKLDRFSVTHEQVVQENDRLKKETSELRKLLSEAQLARTYTSLRDLDDDIDDEVVLVPSCTTAHLRAQSSQIPTNKSSSNLLH